MQKSNNVVEFKPRNKKPKNKEETQLKKYQEVCQKLFSDDVDFCADICCARGKCSGYACCYEQIKEMFEEIKEV